MEPALTNIGIVLPDAGYLDGSAADPEARCAARDRRDAHPLRRARWVHRGVGPRSRLVVVGKPIGGGIPSRPMA